MKQLPIILCLVLLSSYSYSKETREMYDLEIRVDGLTYKVNVFGITSKTPFTGSSVTYYENGQLVNRRNYKNGKLEGLWEGYYDTGSIRIRKNYKNDELEGLSEGFSLEGTLWSKGNYKDGKKDGLHMDGGDKTNYKNGKKHGLHEMVIYGCLVSRGTYKDGKKDGLWEDYKYYHDKKTCSTLHSGPEGKTNYKNGRKVGLQVGYYPPGVINDVICYDGTNRSSDDYYRIIDSKSSSSRWDDDFESILDTYLESILDGTYCEN